MTASPKELMTLAAQRIEELLQDLSQACGGADSYDYGTVSLIRDLREAAS